MAPGEGGDVDRDGEAPAGEGGGPRRRGRSRWVALALVLALAGWMASGIVTRTGESGPAVERARAPEPFLVEVSRSVAGTVERTLVIEGNVEPDLSAPVRAQAGGVVDAVLVDRGERVAAGDVVVRIAPAERQARLAQARAELERATQDYEAAARLRERGFATERRVDEAAATLAAARAAVRQAEERLEDLQVRAPAAGTVDRIEVDPGEVVQPGEEVARVVDTDPLVVDVRVPQQSISGVRTGMDAVVAFVTGEVREGLVTFVAETADSATRTFEVEIRVPNPDRDVPAGISAEVALPLGEETAHFVSPAILSLGPEGLLGIKAVDEDGRVAFHRIRLVKAQTQGIWVGGLPDTLDVITVGQGFVTAGQPVRVRRRGEDGAGASEPGGALLPDAPVTEDLPGPPAAGSVEVRPLTEAERAALLSGEGTPRAGGAGAMPQAPGEGAGAPGEPPPSPAGGAGPDGSDAPAEADRRTEKTRARHARAAMPARMPRKTARGGHGPLARASRASRAGGD